MVKSLCNATRYNQQLVCIRNQSENRARWRLEPLTIIKFSFAARDFIQKHH